MICLLLTYLLFFLLVYKNIDAKTEPRFQRLLHEDDTDPTTFEHHTKHIHKHGRCCSKEEGGSEDLNSTICNFMPYNTTVLLHSPEEGWPAFHPGPCLAFERVYMHEEKPDFSILVTVFNRGNILEVSLTQLLRMTTGSWELIILFDGCTDNSLEVARDLILKSGNWPQCSHGNNIDPNYVWEEGEEARTNKLNQMSGVGEECFFQKSTLLRVKFVVVPMTGLLATAGNNIQMRMARGHYFILVDDDQIMTVLSWNEKLVFPIREWKDVFSVSMRCAHGWPHYSDDDMSSVKCRDTRNVYPNNTYERCTFKIRDSGNRGPLALRAPYVRKLGYMDQINFAGVLTTGCDHDMNKRAYTSHKWVSGSLAIPFTEQRCCRTHSTAEEKEHSDKYKEWFFTRKSLFKDLSPNYGPSNDHNEERKITSEKFYELCL